MYKLEYFSLLEKYKCCPPYATIFPELSPEYPSCQVLRNMTKAEKAETQPPLSNSHKLKQQD